MAQGIGNNSTQCGILVYLSNTYSSGTSISIRDTSDNEIISYTSVKSFSSIVFSSNKLIKNNTYNIYIYIYILIIVYMALLLLIVLILLVVIVLILV